LLQLFINFSRNRELEQFALVVSHDLREPLRGISTFAAFLRDEYAGHLEATGSMYIQTILESTRRMEKLITSLTHYSLIGKLDIYAPVDLNALLQDVLTDLTMVIQARQAVITVDPLPITNTNETAMRELFQNLIVNAIKYCHKSVIPNVHVSVNDAPSHFHFSIKDNGIGIDPQYHDRIFEVFERLHTKDEYEGTGIGLAHCKKIVEMHGGRIWVNSTPEKGSTFHFTIPKSSKALAGNAVDDSITIQ
jgi:two-component system, sensor histidine kinase